MKKILLIVLSLFLTANIYGQESLQEFNEILGEEQSSAFDHAVESYKTFLKLNYPDQESLVDQNAQFLKDFHRIYTSAPPDWIFPDDTQSILNQWEESGLRKEIRLWTDEKYIPQHFPDWGENDDTYSIHIEIEDEIIPITKSEGKTTTEPLERDNFLVSNNLGKFVYALDQCCSSDTIVYNYVEVKQRVGDISPSIMASAYSEFGERLNDPITLRMIVAELYYWLMLTELEKEKVK